MYAWRSNPCRTRSRPPRRRWQYEELEPRILYAADTAALASLGDIGAAWRELIGPHYPAMAVVEVKGLVEDAARLEIETTAVIA